MRVSVFRLVVAFSAILPCACSNNVLKRAKRPNTLKKDKKCKESKCNVDDSDLPKDLQNTGVIALELDEGVTRTFTQATTGTKDSWHGEDGLASMDIVTRETDTEGTEDSSTLVFCSMSDEEKVYQIAPDEFGNTQVTERRWADIPPEGEPLALPESLVADGQRRTLENFPVKRKLSSVVKLRPRFEIDEDGQRRKLFDDNGGNIDILVVWSRDAECTRVGKSPNCVPTKATTDGMLGLVELAIEETNVAFTKSGVQTQLRLVHAYRDPTYTEALSDQHTKALSHITSTQDGIMDDVHTKRLEYGADMVAMIIAGRRDPNLCGVAWIGPNFASMFSVTRWDCATGIYTFGHELGHNMGCHHDKGTENACLSRNYNYGWRDPSARFRTMLAYNCDTGKCDRNRGGGCPRIQRFSTPRVKFNYNGKSVALGDAVTDNARQINEQRAKIARYVPVVECAANNDCDDKDPCTLDTCNTLTGQCSHVTTCLPRGATHVPSAAPSSSMAPTFDMETLLTSKKATNGAGGNMFKISVTQNVEIFGLDIHTKATSMIRVYVYTRPGNYVLSDASQWTLVQDTNVMGLGEGTLTSLPLFDTPVVVNATSSQSFYVSLTTNDIRYTDGKAEGRLFATDGIVNFYEGRGLLAHPLFSESFAPRVWNGNIHYIVRGGAGLLPPPVKTITPSPTAAPTGFPTQQPTLSPTRVPTQTPTPGGASTTVETLFTTKGGKTGASGNMFQISVTQDVKVLGLDVHIRDAKRLRVLVYTKEGNYKDAMNQRSKWTLIQDVRLQGLGAGNLTPLPDFATPVLVNATTQSFYVTLERKHVLTYSRGTQEGRLYKSNGILNFHEGIGVVFPFSRTYSPRVWNGSIRYSTPCQDSRGWRHLTVKARKRKGCKWVARHPTKRCQKSGTNNVLASDACKVACSSC